MLLKKDLSQCKDLRTVEHLAQQFGWYAAAWTPQEPHLICSDEQFTEFAKALGKLAVTQDGENLLYFLALAAETAQERKNRMDRILERKLFYETSTVITEADIARCHNDQLATPPGVRKADAMETLHFLAPPEEEKQDDTAPNGIVSISAKDLQDKEFKPIKWVVEGLLPQGLALLVAPPKYGKSWLMLDLCLSVASGQKFLDMPTNKTDCLYLALEDNQRRLQDRMNRVLQGERAPDGFALATGSLDLQDGLLDQLTNYLNINPGCGLVVIDTLQRVRRTTGKAINAYQADYKDVGILQKFASEREICIVLVHHLRKMKDETDPFAQISGTNGIFGAADSAFVMTRDRRVDDTTKLSVTGRDLEEFELALRLDKTQCRWQNLGDAEARAREQARKEYENSALVQTIRKLVERNHGQWSGTAKEILEAGKLLTRRFIAESPKDVGVRVKKLENEMREFDGIVYERVKRGTSGALHYFCKENMQVQNEIQLDLSKQVA